MAARLKIDHSTVADIWAQYGVKPWKADTFKFSTDLTTKIRAFITGWNRRKHPFIWTKPANQILASSNRKRKHVSTTDH